MSKYEKNVVLKAGKQFKKDTKTGKFYTFPIIVSTNYKKATWNGTSYDPNTGSGIRFPMPHDQVKLFDFEHYIYYARYNDEDIKCQSCLDYDVLARDKATGKLSMFYKHQTAADQHNLADVSAFDLL